jgi:glycosyltransferase involved in cell wall biosynthesis
MRIFVHDFAGHPFQFQLSRELVRRGHSVTHAYFADLSGPKGNFQVTPDEAPFLTVEAIKLDSAFNRYSYLQRLKVHNNYARILKAKIRDYDPRVVISGNTPTDVQYLLTADCVSRDIRFVHWVQDFYALALETLLRRKLGSLSRFVASPFYLLERRIFRTSDAVVYISDDFSSYAASKGFAPKRQTTIENWASLDELTPREKTNAFSLSHSLSDKFVFLYSGTMGLKHNPLGLVELARNFRDRPEVRVVLISEGVGRNILEEHKQREGLENLLLLDYQPFEILPEVLASADVLVANVEAESSAFCVPSKILSYLCAGRPILLSVPRDNLAARVLDRAGAGFTCNPGDCAEFLERAEALWRQKDVRASMAINARRYAESMFNMNRIGNLFESVLGEAIPAYTPVLTSAATGAAI